jgi:hypothetical protein
VIRLSWRDKLLVARKPGEGAQAGRRSGTGHRHAVASGQHGGLEPGQPFD